MEEQENHNCANSLEFLKIKSSDKSYKYQCTICLTLYRKAVNQYNHLVEDLIPYKCSGYSTIDGKKIKCQSNTMHFRRNNAYCDKHLPKKIIVANKNITSVIDSKSKREYINIVPEVAETCSLFKQDYDSCKDNLTGYLEL